MLLDTRGLMGDVVVLTSSRSVAEWAQEVAVVSGPLGTRYGLVPVVVMLTGDTTEQLLDEAHPELAFFAAFAMHERHGPTARRVVTRALQLAARLPEPLQQAQLRAIFNVLSEPMLAWLEEMSMQPETTLESEAFRALRQRLEARGEVRGEAQALLTVLGARGFVLDDAARARVLACKDRTLLERWLARAVTGPSLDEVFADG